MSTRSCPYLPRPRLGARPRLGVRLYWVRGLSDGPSIFPEDRARWTASPSIRTTFSHQQGRYEIEGLPIADYRVVAVTALPRNAWRDPAVLARLWPSASPVSLDELGEGTLHLRVVPPPTDLIE